MRPFARPRSPRYHCRASLSHFVLAVRPAVQMLPAMRARLTSTPNRCRGCVFELGCRKLGWRLKSRQIESGLLPEFQVALPAL
jgi:hypothetical protein